GLCTERITLSGCTLGSMRSCLELSLKYSKERVQFGKPIASFQSIQEKLANMYTGYLASKWMAYSAASFCDSLTSKVGGKGTDLDRMAAASLLYCGEMGTKIGLDAIQIHGGYGYMTEGQIEHFYRDARALDLFTEPGSRQRSLLAEEITSWRS
ncbi:MAG: acyl-CoA dehydrogenase, partial [Deltaproteobacteria bacterium HGW-Deltaproteobacteria-21]